jgi:hypothetical protein
MQESLMSSTTVSGKTRQLPAVSGSVKVLQPIGTVGNPADRKGEIEVTSNTARGPVVRRYFVEVHDHGYRLVGWDSKRREVTLYDIPASADSCDCRDFLQRSDKRPDHLCKHCHAVRSLIEKGKLPRVECRPVVDYTALEDAEIDTQVDALAERYGWQAA